MSMNEVASTVRLTGREAEVLRLIACGCTYAEVAEQLGMSAHTVGSHIKNAWTASLMLTRCPRR